MKVLTVRQPWAWAIIHGGKGIENRGYLPKWRGPVAIHAALQVDSDGFRDPAIGAAGGLAADMQFGVIIGVVDFTDGHVAIPSARLDGSVGCCCEPWGRPRQSHLVLDNPRALEHPIAWRGRLGLTSLPPDVEDDITRQVNAQTR